MSNDIADGWYDAKAETWAWKQASTGTWQLEIWFELSDQGGVVGRLPGWFAVTDNTVEKRFEQFTALGYQPVTGDLGQEIGCDAEGRCFGGLDVHVVRAVVKTEADRNGVQRTKVDNIVAQKAKGAVQTADPNALRAFGAQMKGAVMAAMQRAKAGGAAPAQPQARPAAPASRPAAPQRPAPTPTRGPGARPQQAAQQAYDPTGGDDDFPPF